MKWMVLARGGMQEVMVKDIRDCMTICPIKIQISARLLILGLNNRGVQRYSVDVLFPCSSVIRLPKTSVHTHSLLNNPARPRCIAWPILCNVKPHASIYFHNVSTRIELVPAIFSSAYRLPPEFRHAHTP